MSRYLIQRLQYNIVKVSLRFSCCPKRSVFPDLSKHVAGSIKGEQRLLGNVSVGLLA